MNVARNEYNILIWTLTKKELVLYQLKWLAIYLGSAFLISILLPFPIDWAVAIPVFLLISLFRRKLLMKKLGIDRKSNSTDNNLKNIGEFFKSVSSNAFGSADYGYRQVKYYCMRCGNEHKKVACPKCGSKMKKIG